MPAVSDDPGPDRGGAWEPFTPQVYEAGSGEYVAVLLHPHHAINPRLEVAGSRASACRGDRVVGSLSTSGRHYGSHQTNAVVWDLARRRAMNLHRGPYYYDTHAAGFTGPECVVGYATWPIYADDEEDDRVYRPVVWSGTPESLIDLLEGDERNRSGGANSVCAHEEGGVVVTGGYVSRSPSAASEAALWRLPEARSVSLHPSGFVGSRVNAVGPTVQAGCGWRQPDSSPAHALLWRGSASEWTDLHPPSLYASEATALWEDTRNGAVRVGGQGDGKALLWRGDAAETVVFLHPPGYRQTGITGLYGGGGGSGDLQVGYGMLEAPEDDYPPNHALLWRGTPESVVDLHRLLPPECYASVASGIDPTGSGTVCGFATLRHGSGPTTQCAVVWIPKQRA